MTLSLPTLPGLAFPVVKRPVTETIVANHPSGREVRTPLNSGRWEWELSFEGLASDNGVIMPGLGAQSMQALLSLYMLCQGSVGTFLYTDPTDSAAENQFIATGDGSTSVFTAVRSIGAATEPVGFISALTSVKVNGVAPTSFSVVAPNKISISPTPANGSTISASFSYQFMCRFMDDSIDFEEFFSAVWRLKSLKFRSVLQ